MHHKTFSYTLALLASQNLYAETQIETIDFIRSQTDKTLYQAIIGIDFISKDIHIKNINTDKIRDSTTIKINDNEIDHSKVTYKLGSYRQNLFRGDTETHYGKPGGFFITIKDLPASSNQTITINGNIYAQTFTHEYKKMKDLITLEIGEKISIDKTDKTITFKVKEQNFPRLFFKTIDGKTTPQRRMNSTINGKGTSRTLSIAFKHSLESINSWGLLMKSPKTESSAQFSATFQTPF